MMTSHLMSITQTLTYPEFSNSKSSGRSREDSIEISAADCGNNAGFRYIKNDKASKKRRM